MNNVVFWKRMWENVRKYRDTKLVIAEGRRNCLMSETDYHTTKFLWEIS